MDNRIYDLMEQVFPGRWDFQVDPDLPEWERFIIHFPEIEITNSRNHKHTIYDLYTRLTFENGRISASVEGTRTTLTYAEYVSSYWHSHITSSSGSDLWKNFCLGQAGVRTSLASIQSLPYDSWSESTFERFEVALYELPQYLGWESLSGGPYKRMANIGDGNIQGDVAESISADIYTDLLRHAPSCIHFKYDSSMGWITLIVDENLYTELASWTPEEHHVFRTDRGQWYNNVKVLGAEIFNSNYPGFMFKGKEVRQDILVNTGENENRKRYPHPDITEYVKRQLEFGANELFRQQITSQGGLSPRGTGKWRYTNNISEAVRQNLLPVTSSE